MRSGMERTAPSRRSSRCRSSSRCNSMNMIIGMVFTVLYAVLSFFLALAMSIHGPELIVHFSAGFLVIAIAAIWSIYFFLRRRDPRYKTLIFSSCALGIGLLLGGTIIASREPLVNLDVYRMERHAANTAVSN